MSAANPLSVPAIVTAIDLSDRHYAYIATAEVHQGATVVQSLHTVHLRQFRTKPGKQYDHEQLGLHLAMFLKPMCAQLLVLGSRSQGEHEEWTEILKDIPCALYQTRAVHGAFKRLESGDDELVESGLLIFGNWSSTHFGYFRRREVVLENFCGGGINHIPNDVSMGLGMPIREAWALVLNTSVEAILAAGENKEPDWRDPAYIIHMRLKETVENLHRSLCRDKVAIENIEKIYLVGNMAHQTAFPELVFRQFKIPVKVASACRMGGTMKSDPRYETVLGLLEIGAKQANYA